MDDAACRLTVYFEEPFWVGVYERSDGGKLTVAKVIFGTEPKDYEVYAYFLKNWHNLRFSSPLAQEQPEKAMNPKRMQRAISKQLAQTGTGTRAQQALKLQQEQNKLERKTKHRREKEEEKERKLEIRQQKKKEKHRGR